MIRLSNNGQLSCTGLIAATRQPLIPMSCPRWSGSSLIRAIQPGMKNLTNASAPPPHRKKNGAISFRLRHSNLNHYSNAPSPVPSAEKSAHKTRRFLSVSSWAVFMEENPPGRLSKRTGKRWTRCFPNKGCAACAAGSAASPHLNSNEMCGTSSPHARSTSAGKRSINILNSYGSPSRFGNGTVLPCAGIWIDTDRLLKQRTSLKASCRC